MRIRQQFRDHAFRGHLVSQPQHGKPSILVGPLAQIQEGFGAQRLLMGGKNLDECSLRGSWVDKQFEQAMRVIASTVREDRDNPGDHARIPVTQPPHKVG